MRGFGCGKLEGKNERPRTQVELRTAEGLQRKEKNAEEKINSDIDGACL